MAIPPRIIIIWSGSTINIPDGWFLCDGNNDTPDLRDRFVVGSETSYVLNDTGGFANATLVSHTHTGSTASENFSHNHGIFRVSAGAARVRIATGRAFSGITVTGSSSGNHSHTITIDDAGESAINANLPPYFALAYIMKGAN
jgi:microcystin-dependent protein